VCSSPQLPLKIDTHSRETWLMWFSRTLPAYLPLLVLLGCEQSGRRTAQAAHARQEDELAPGTTPKLADLAQDARLSAAMFVSNTPVECLSVSVRSVRKKENLPPTNAVTIEKVAQMLFDDAFEAHRGTNRAALLADGVEKRSESLAALLVGLGPEGDQTDSARVHKLNTLPWSIGDVALAFDDGALMAVPTCEMAKKVLATCSNLITVNFDGNPNQSVAYDPLAKVEFRVDRQMFDRTRAFGNDTAKTNCHRLKGSWVAPEEETETAAGHIATADCQKFEAWVGANRKAVRTMLTQLEAHVAAGRWQAAHRILDELKPHFASMHGDSVSVAETGDLIRLYQRVEREVREADVRTLDEFAGFTEELAVHRTSAPAAAVRQFEARVGMTNAFALALLAKRLKSDHDLFDDVSVRIDGAKTLRGQFVSVDELLRAYRVNELRADALYKGKTVVTTGRLVQVRQTFGQISLLLGGNGGFGLLSTVRCGLEDDASIARAARLDENDLVTVRGEGGGKLVLSVNVEHCQLLAF
jgi:hypothetical protein